MTEKAGTHDARERDQSSEEARIQEYRDASFSAVFSFAEGELLWLPVWIGPLLVGQNEA